jgi:hypothetical protein
MLSLCRVAGEYEVELENSAICCQQIATKALPAMI